MELLTKQWTVQKAISGYHLWSFKGTNDCPVYSLSHPVRNELSHCLFEGDDVSTLILTDHLIRQCDSQGLQCIVGKKINVKEIKINFIFHKIITFLLEYVRCLFLVKTLNIFISQKDWCVTRCCWDTWRCNPIWSRQPTRPILSFRSVLLYTGNPVNASTDFCPGSVLL